MVHDGATLEDVARQLWDCGEDDPFTAPSPTLWPAVVAPLATDASLPPLERAMATIPLLALDVRHSFNSAPRVRHEIAAGLLRHNAALLVAQPPSGAPVHRVLAQAWHPGDDGFADLVRAALVESGSPCAHEVSLAPRCRIDLVCPGGIGIEIKRGQPDRKRIVMQLTRYAACGQISALILVTERTVAVPNRIHGKPISCVCLNRLWGIAL